MISQSRYVLSNQISEILWPNKNFLFRVIGKPLTNLAFLAIRGVVTIKGTFFL